MCYLAPHNCVNAHSEDYYVVKYAETNGETWARVLSPRAHEGSVSTAPSVEDGYLCATRSLPTILLYATLSALLLCLGHIFSRRFSG